ncbi:MAG TPA: PEP/pyruvate-binding domain-containing protein [Pseudomonadales bacterium]|nr:PEP/pyruvate-binding domain-containing protein [Pseudomonadales bacterium]
MNFVPVPFIDCMEEERFGGKVKSLGEACRAGLPVPPGYGVEVELVNAVVSGEAHATSAVKAAFEKMACNIAVRSSAVGEDSTEASFAGQHDSIMNVNSGDAVVDAIVQVFRSAHTESAYAYRAKVDVSADARIAVAMQEQVPSDKAGVLFTRNPLTGAEERYIEVSWGLGEAVVGGIVVPDSFRIAPHADRCEVLERSPGEKDIMLVLNQQGGTDEIKVPPERVTAPCLDDIELAKLHDLALRCERAYGSNLDVEFAFHAGNLYLLQCRTITVLHKL